MDTKKLTDREFSYKSIRKQIMDSYTFKELDTSMLLIDYFTRYFCDTTDESLKLQSDLLNLHNEQSSAVTNGKKRPLWQRFLNIFTT